ncbi:MAG TPA: hypothetical protein VFS27_02715 [Blastocatellia bacterium]|jgi:hypothetical protein|nr:hypothetical protein [Blastocatellia bacterium]
MLVFPINTETFKKSFLSGDGQIEVQSDQDIWMTLVVTGGKFLPTVTRIAGVNFKFANAQKFRLGRGDGMRLSVSAGAGAEIRLIWPDENDEALKALGLSAFLSGEKLYARLFFSANGDLAADARIPVGALTLSGAFGVGAGGKVAYERLKVYDAQTTAKEILGDLLAGTRLPQQVSAVTEIPEPGEALITRFGGYLKLKAAMNWGYQMTGSRSIEFNQLSLDLDYGLRAMATVSVGCRLAGDFSVEARRGAEDGWARFVVRKSRDSQFDFAADFDLDGEVELKGLPQSADEFLIRLIGADARTVLDYFKKAEEYASLDELEKKLTPMVKGFVHEWSQDLIGKALGDDTLKDFLAAARRVAETYNNLDERIVNLYHSYLDKIPQLRRSLGILAGAPFPADLAGLTENGEEDSLDSWDVAQLLWGASVYPLLLQNERFAEFSQLARKAQAFVEDGATAPVRDFLSRLKSATRLDPLFEKLGEIKSADQLRQIGDEKLQEITGRLIGLGFDKIENSRFNAAFEDLQKSLKRIKDFKQIWYARLKEAVSDKIKLDLHYAYTRASRDEKLIDVELNLNRGEGRELALTAAAGDFSGVLENYNTNYARINDGVFTHEVRRSAQLQINVMGWGYDSLKQLTQNVEHAIEERSGGLLHVYATETTIEQRRAKGRKFKEIVESNFLLRAVGETIQDSADMVERTTRQYMLQTLGNLTAQYTLLESNERASVEELEHYLDLAEFLGLFEKQGRQAFVSDLAGQFPGGLGKVKIDYIVRYDNTALRDAMGAVSGDELRELARQTMRRLVGAKYTGMKQTDWMARVGFAYLSPAVYEVYDRGGFTALRRAKIVVTLPEWFTKGPPRKEALSREDAERLSALYFVENEYVDGMARLDKILDQALKEKKPIPLDELKEAAREFARMADDVDKWRENAFFAIFDKVVEAALKKAPRDKAARESAMVLEITPDGTKKVTKALARRI